MDSNKDKKKKNNNSLIAREDVMLLISVRRTQSSVFPLGMSPQRLSKKLISQFFAARRSVNIKASSVSQNTHRGSLGGVQRKEEAASVSSSVAEITVVSRI